MKLPLEPELLEIDETATDELLELLELLESDAISIDELLEAGELTELLLKEDGLLKTTEEDSLLEFEGVVDAVPPQAVIAAADIIRRDVRTILDSH